MLVLHGSWLPGPEGSAGAFVVWGRRREGLGRPRAAPKRTTRPAPGVPLGVPAATPSPRGALHCWRRWRARSPRSRMARSRAVGQRERSCSPGERGARRPPRGRRLRITSGLGLMRWPPRPAASPASAGMAADLLVRLPSTARGPLASPGAMQADAPPGRRAADAGHLAGRCGRIRAGRAVELLLALPDAAGHVGHRAGRGRAILAGGCPLWHGAAIPPAVAAHAQPTGRALRSTLERPARRPCGLGAVRGAHRGDAARLPCARHDGRGAWLPSQKCCFGTSSMR